MAGQTFEGGIRVPGIARWPGVFPAGAVLHEAVSMLDLMPTFLSVMGAQEPQDRIIDGEDVMELLKHPHNTTGRSSILWHYCGHNVTAGAKGGGREGCGVHVLLLCVV